MENLIYLDNGATSFPKPDEVYTFMDSFYRSFGVNPGRSGYDLCMETGELVDNTRKLLTDFFNGNDPNRLCFSYNSTDALNLIIFGMLEQGDHAITTTLEHNSVLRPLYHQSKFNGVEVDYIPFDPNGFIDPDDINNDKTGICFDFILGFLFCHYWTLVLSETSCKDNPTVPRVYGEVYRVCDSGHSQAQECLTAIPAPAFGRIGLL